MNQRSLFDDWQEGHGGLTTIQERFEAFDAAHPEVYGEFCQIATDLRAKGFEHYGAKAIIEVIRFHRRLAKGPEEDFKINNNYTSRYVRKFVEEHPEFEGFFETRELTAK